MPNARAVNVQAMTLAEGMRSRMRLGVQALFMFPIFMLGCIFIALCAAVLGARYIVRNLVRPDCREPCTEHVCSSQQHACL